MKKLAASLLAICSMVAYVHAQGTFIVDSSVNSGNGTGPNATTGGLVWIANGSGTNLDTSTDISLQVMWGTSAGAINNTLNMDPNGLNAPANTAWLASQASGSSDITFLGNGTIVDPNGINYIVPGEAAGTVLFLQLQGWTGSSTTYAGAATSHGETAPFSITLGLNSSPTQPDVSGMGALVIVQAVPEPSILALSSIGAAALMLIRRKK